MKAALAILILLTAMLASCTGGAPASLENEGSPGRSAGDSGDFEGWEEWQQVLADPGIAGTDYDPLAITVNYRADAEFSLSGISLPPPGGRAAEMPNPQLRADKRYEAVTDHISGRFGMPISQQVYLDGVLMASFRLPPGSDGATVIEAIRSDYSAQVLDVTYSRLIQACFSPNDRYYLLSDADRGGQWGLHRIGVPAAWQRSTGDPLMLVGVVDSGCLMTHEEIGAGVLNPQQQFPAASCDLLDGDGDVTDTDGHGTAACSVIAAQTDNFSGLAAVLPTSRVLPLRVAAGRTTTHAHVVAGCMLARELGCRIVSLGWASERGSRQLSGMATALAGSDVLLLAAAGNTGNTDEQWPAAYSAVCGVAASGMDERLAADSSHGNWCDVSAPGTGFSVPSILRDNLYSESVSGSSLATALASGAYGLLWSIAPELEAAELRDLVRRNAHPLEDGGPARIDLPAVLHELEFPTIGLARPELLQEQDYLLLEPQVGGQPDRLELWIDNTYVMSRQQAPWQITVDLRQLSGGSHSLELRAVAMDSTEYAADGFSFLRRHPEMAMPWNCGFEQGAGELAWLDLGGHAAALQEELLEQAGIELEIDPALMKQHNWQIDRQDAWQGQASLRLSAGQPEAGRSGMSVLLSPPVSLAGYPDATLSLAMRWELDDMLAMLLFSADGGLSWQVAKEQSGFSGRLSGEQGQWRQLRYSLANWPGDSLQMLLLTVQPAGTDATQEMIAVDSLSLATQFQPSLPVVDGVTLANNVLGAVPGLKQLDVQLIGAHDVVKARYWLDCAPLGSEGPEDVITEAILGASLPASITLPAAQSGNRHAVLRVDYFDSLGSSGPRFNEPVWLFDRRGDGNADGIVDMADWQLLQQQLGSRLGEAGFIPFLDSDLDGVVSELDAAAVAYNLN